MEVLEGDLTVPLAEFLDRPLFCFLAQESAGGARVSPLRFLWEDEAAWIIAVRERSYPDRVREYPDSALAVVDFDPRTGRVEHVGMRGRASLEPWDVGRAGRLLEGPSAPTGWSGTGCSRPTTRRGRP